MVNKFTTEHYRNCFDRVFIVFFLWFWFNHHILLASNDEQSIFKSVIFQHCALLVFNIHLVGERPSKYFGCSNCRLFYSLMIHLIPIQNPNDLYFIHSNVVFFIANANISQNLIFILLAKCYIVSTHS